MKPLIKVAVFTAGLLALVGCARERSAAVVPVEVPPDGPAEFRIESAQLLQAESWPVQVRLEVAGVISSACHQVEASVAPPDPEGRIAVEVFEEAIEDEECPSAAQPFRESIRIGEYASGAYEVLLNGEVIGEFNLGAMPVSADQEFERGPAFIDEAELEFAGDAPLRVELVLRGSLPTPCHTLHWTSEPPDAEGRIEIEVYSLYDPALSCIQVLEPVEATVPIGSFTGGSYSVWVNGEQVGEFQP